MQCKLYIYHVFVSICLWMGKSSFYLYLITFATGIGTSLYRFHDKLPSSLNLIIYATTVPSKNCICCCINGEVWCTAILKENKILNTVWLFLSTAADRHPHHCQSSPNGRQVACSSNTPHQMTILQENNKHHGPWKNELHTLMICHSTWANSIPNCPWKYSWMVKYIFLIELKSTWNLYHCHQC